MSELLSEMLDMSAQVFSQNTPTLAENAKLTDRKINKLDEETESLAIEIIALRSPKASDLRETIAALKIAVILERMGDLSKNITRKISKIDIKINKSTLNTINKMTSKVAAMLDLITSSLHNEHLQDIELIFELENEVDDLYNIARISLEDQISQNQSQKQTSDLLTIIFAIKNYERIADYITKIAYILKYVITGERRIYED